jgi:hypothetical protein
MSEDPYLAEAKEYWRIRMTAVGKAQGRYIFWLFVAGVFYLALTSRILHGSGGAPSPQALELPFVQIEIDALVVWATAPITLGLIVMAVLGTFPALATALVGLKDALGVHPTYHHTAHESFDPNFTFLDSVAYTTADSPQRLKVAWRLVYPLVLTVFYVEGVVLWFLVWRHTVRCCTLCVPSPEGPILLGLGAIALALPLHRFYKMWPAFLRSPTPREAEPEAQAGSQPQAEPTGSPPTTGQS